MYQHRRRDSTASAAPSSPGTGRVSPRAAKAVQKHRGAKAAHRSVYVLAPRAINAHRRNTVLRKGSKHASRRVSRVNIPGIQDSSVKTETL